MNYCVCIGSWVRVVLMQNLGMITEFQGRCLGSRAFRGIAIYFWLGSLGDLKLPRDSFPLNLRLFFRFFFLLSFYVYGCLCTVCMQLW